MTLVEATRRFIGLNSTNDSTRAAGESSFPGDTYEEKAARNVIEFPRPEQDPAAHPRAIPRDVRQKHFDEVTRRVTPMPI